MNTPKDATDTQILDMSGDTAEAQALREAKAEADREFGRPHHGHDERAGASHARCDGEGIVATVEKPDGVYVRYDDYKALLDRLESAILNGRLREIARANAVRECAELSLKLDNAKASRAVNNVVVETLRCIEAALIDTVSLLQGSDDLDYAARLVRIDLESVQSLISTHSEKA